MSYSIGFDIFAKDRASKTFNDVGDSASKTGGRLSKFGVMAAAGVAVAGVAVLKFAKDSVAASQDAQKSQRVLDDAYARFPALADVNIAKMRELASAIQQKTKFDGDDINAAQGVLAQYKLTGKQVMTMTPLLADYAEKTGQDLPTAAKTMGLALMGNAKALKAIGINMPKAGESAKMLGKAQIEVEKSARSLKDAQQDLADLTAIQAGKDKLTIQDQFAMRDAREKVAEAMGRSEQATQNLSKAQAAAGKTGDRFAQITAGLRTQVGGFAEREGKSLEGQTAILKNKFDDIKEAVGARLIPVLIRMSGWFISTGLPAVQRFGGWISGSLWPALQKGYQTIMPGVQRALAILKGGVDGNSVSWKQIGDIITGKVIPILAKVAAVYLPMLAAQWRVIIGVVRTVWGVFQTLMSVVSTVVSFILRRFADLTSMWAGVLRALGKVPGFGWAKDAAAKMDAASRKARGLATDIDNIDRNVAVKVSVTTMYYDKGAKPGSRGIKPSERAVGGPVTAGMPYLVGENEPELFIPNQSGRILNQRQMASAAGSRGGARQVEHVLVIKDQDGRTILRKLLDYQRQTGQSLGFI